MSPTRTFQRVFLTFFSLFILLSISGCVKFDLDLTVNNDSSVSGTMIFAISKSLNDLGNQQSPESPANDLVDPESEGVTTEPYDDGDFVGQKITLDHVPFSQFSSGGESGDLTIVREGDLITLKGFLDLGDDTTQKTTEEDLGGVLGQALVNSIFSSADLKIRITFPAEVVSTTGSLSEDKRTVTWKPKIGQDLDLTTTVKVPTFNFILYGASAGGILMLLGIVLWFINRNQKKSSENINLPDIS